ncbi:MAG: hypothetical protein HYU64_03165 [Armatimonadetes bacterium]|nr:hypothetical protein [Armatimonadota bacterium]
MNQILSSSTLGRAFAEDKDAVNALIDAESGNMGDVVDDLAVIREVGTGHSAMAGKIEQFVRLLNAEGALETDLVQKDYEMIGKSLRPWETWKENTDSFLNLLEARGYQPYPGQTAKPAYYARENPAYNAREDYLLIDQVVSRDSGKGKEERMHATKKLIDLMKIAGKDKAHAAFKVIYGLPTQQPAKIERYEANL